MCERRRIFLDKKVFTPVYGEDGHFPPAPPEAITEYGRLKSGWLVAFPKLPGREPAVSLYPVTEDGKTCYIVAREIIVIDP